MIIINVILNQIIVYKIMFLSPQKLTSISPKHLYIFNNRIESSEIAFSLRNQVTCHDRKYFLPSILTPVHISNHRRLIRAIILINFYFFRVTNASLMVSGIRKRDRVARKSHFAVECRTNLNRSTEICCEMYNAPQEMTSSLSATLERDRKRKTAPRWKRCEELKGFGTRENDDGVEGWFGVWRMKQTEINRSGDTCTHILRETVYQRLTERDRKCVTRFVERERQSVDRETVGQRGRFSRNPGRQPRLSYARISRQHIR